MGKGDMVSVNATEPRVESKGLNESTTIAERAPDGAPLSNGPVRGEKDSYLPASYKTTRSGLIRTDR